MATESTEGLAVLDYLGVIARWKWLIIGVTVAFGVAGLAYVKTRTPMYEASAQLLYVQQVTISNPLVQGSLAQSVAAPDIDTVSAMVTSSQVSSAAGELLRDKDVSAGYSVSVVSGVKATNSSGNSSATVVGMQAVSSSPRTAAAAANAYAQAFVTWRGDIARTQVREALAAVEAALQSYATHPSNSRVEYLQLKQAQQALQLQLESFSSDFSIISPATPPSVPFSPRTLHTLALAVILGLALSLGLAFLLEQLDTRVRDERQMSDMLGMSVLAHLPPLTRRTGKEGTVQMLANPSGPMAEAVRVLRSNLSFTGVDGDIHTLLLTSSIRSEGKSVTACNLAVSMALAGQRVVLVDADFRRPRIHTYMGVSNVVGFSSVLARRADLWGAVLPITLEGAVEPEADATAAKDAPARDAAMPVVSLASDRHGHDLVTTQLPHQPDVSYVAGEDAVLRVLPSGPVPPNPGEMTASQRFGEIVGMLADKADLVIIDSPPLLEVGDAGAIAAKADGVVFVVNMSRIRWPMLERAHAQLTKLPCRKLGLVVVSAKSEQKRGYGYGYGYYGAPSQNGGRRPDSH